MGKYLALFLLFTGALSAKIPEGFLWGAVTSEYQVSGSKGCPNSSWAAFEQKEGAICGGDLSLEACNHFEWGDRYIGALKALKCNAYRFSIEWSKFQPLEDEYDESVLEKYSEFVDHLLAAGITPMVVLHHFSDPAWFLEKGGFEKAEKCPHFIDFAIKVMQKLGDRVSLFVTFNEPTVYAVHGYNPPLFGEAFPPSQDNSSKLAVVLANMLRAHCSIYQNAKRTLSYFPDLKIGIIHQFLKFEKTDRLSHFYVKHLEHRYHDAFYEALKNKKFEFNYLAYSSYKVHFSKPLKEMIDFIGVNYFTKPLIRSSKSACNEGEFMTDSDYRCYPQGLYEMISEVKELGIPIYVTGNGLADRKDENRARWIREHIHEMKRAIDDGADVRGFFYWSLMDNFEWTKGYSQKFGLYEYDFKTHDMRLREGAKEYTHQISLAGS